jgi:hypothetical protein
MATVADFTRLGLPPQTHAYDDPTLSAIEFLQAVYHATHLPMSTRIDAARGLLPYTEPRPTSIPSSHVGCTIVIGGLGPCDHGPGTRCPSAGSTKNHSENLLSGSKTLTRDGEPGDPQNLTTTPEPSPFIDYSTPPTPEDIQAIKAAINALRPDLAHLPTPEFHLCPCGHWITGTYPCCERARDPSKMN